MLFVPACSQMKLYGTAHAVSGAGMQRIVLPVLANTTLTLLCAAAVCVADDDWLKRYEPKPTTHPSACMSAQGDCLVAARGPTRLTPTPTTSACIPFVHESCGAVSYAWVKYCRPITMGEAQTQHLVEKAFNDATMRSPASTSPSHRDGYIDTCNDAALVAAAV